MRTSRSDLAVTIPSAGADGVRANDDGSTSTRATRGGDVPQGHATAGREGAPFVAGIATDHARPTDAVARRAVRFGEGSAEGRGGGSWRLMSRPPAGAKQKETSYGGAPPTTGGDNKHVPPALYSAPPCTEPPGSGYKAARRAGLSRADGAEGNGDGSRRVASRRPPSSAKVFLTRQAARWRRHGEREAIRHHRGDASCASMWVAFGKETPGARALQFSPPPPGGGARRRSPYASLCSPSRRAFHE